MYINSLLELNLSDEQLLGHCILDCEFLTEFCFSIPEELSKLRSPMIRCGVMSCTMPSSSLNELLHSTGKNSALWPVSTWNLEKCLARICVMLSLIMLVLRMMVVSSTTYFFLKNCVNYFFLIKLVNWFWKNLITWPTPCTTKTICEISASRSVCVHSSL